MILSDMQGAIDYLKEETKVEDVIGEVVRLEEAGNDLIKALCCFHEEKTPSLTITPSKGLYHCFGCKASGDIISFYKDYYHLNTIETIYKLSEKYDIDISNFEREPTAEEKKNIELEKINRRVRDGLNKLLIGGSNRGYEYLTSRGITKETMIEFGLGYSPSYKDIFPLVQNQQQGLTEVLGLSSGNDIQWRDSVVYPTHDHRGRVIGFKNRPYHDGQEVDSQGRTLPKFIGTSSKSPLHSDGVLYGFHIARKNIQDGKLIIVEGQHDVLIAHQHGIKNVVGSDSTGLNKPKIKMLEDHGIKEIVIAYDGDNAGREASHRIASQARDLETKISIKIATLTNGDDPDELIRREGKVKFLQIIHEAVYSSQFMVDQIANQISLSTVTGKMDFIKRCEPLMIQSETFEREFIIRYVAEKVGLDYTIIEDMLRAEQSKLSKSLLYNIDGEKIVLGGMLRDSDFRSEAIDYLKSEDWYLHKHKLLFDIVVEMDRNTIPITVDTIKTTINNKELKQTFNNGSMVDEIYATLGSHETLLEDIKDKSLRRQLLKESDELKRKAQDIKNSTVFVSEEHLDRVEKIVTGVTGQSVVTPQVGAKRFMDTLHDRMQNPGKITGFEMGPNFKILTGLLNGIQSKKLITISANQSVGKTTLTANILNHIAITNKIPWAHFSLEMPEEEMVQKFIGIRSGVNTQRIERGNVTNDEYNKIKQATIEYHESGLFIIDDCITLESIINKTRTLIRNHGVRGISIDYLQLMSLEKSFGKKKYEEEGEISGALKNDVAKRMSIPVIAVSQMSRRALDRDIQKAEDGQGAYKIAQDSDIYMILQDKSQEEINEWGIEYGNQILNLDKNRGGTGDVLIDIYFDKGTQRMSEVTQKEED